MTASALGTVTQPPSAVSPEITGTFVPSTAPTQIVEMKYEIKFYINYDGFVDREPTEEEYEGLRESLEAYFLTYIGQQYEANPSGGTDLVAHNMTLLEADYIPNPTEDRYTHRLFFQSDFAFAGRDPPVKDLFGYYETMSLQELTEKGVWAARPQPGLFYYTAGIFWQN